MSYYIIPDKEEDPEFAVIQGPYKNKDEVIFALEIIGNSAVFNSKQEAREYIEE